MSVVNETKLVEFFMSKGWLLNELTRYNYTTCKFEDSKEFMERESKYVNVLEIFNITPVTDSATGEEFIRFYIHFEHRGKEYLERTSINIRQNETIYCEILELFNKERSQLFDYKIKQITSKYCSVATYSKLIREYVKLKYKDCKFSVRKDNRVINIKLLAGPQMPSNDSDFINKCTDKYGTNSKPDNKLLEPWVKKMFLKIERFIMNFHYDNSDSMVDYFDTNFYYYFGFENYKVK